MLRKLFKFHGGVKPQTNKTESTTAPIGQVPLRLAWALTVHKSQGMSLDEAVIDLSRAFGYGMGYVALSRVRRLDGLHLVGFSASSLAVDPRILAIDRDLQSLSDRAAARLDELPRSDISERQKAFITRCGGCIEPKPASKRPRAHEAGMSTQKTHEISYDMVRSGKSIADVAREPLIMLTVDEAGQSALRYWQQSGHRPQVILHTSSVEAVRSLVATGAGVALLPDLVYRPWSLEGDRIESRDVSGALPVVQVGMVWRKGSSLPQAARDFVGIAEASRSGRIR